MRVILIIEAHGSSPLARGLPQVGGVEVGEARIIPARAGFTGGRPPPRCRISDHPRSRGVYLNAVAGGNAETGSSPLARGLPVVNSGPARTVGIIPARAGFTPA